MKKKIYWWTAANFFDVDMHIVPNLSKIYDISWNVSVTSYDYYNQNFIKKFINDHNINGKVLYLSNRMSSLITLKLFYNEIKRIKQYKPDLIYIDFIGIPYLFPLLAISGIDRNKVVYACHDYVYHLGVKDRNMFVLYKNFIFRFFNKFHLFSLSQKKLFENDWRDKKTFYAPLALKGFGKPTIQKRDDKMVHFLFFGTIRENKGIKYLLQASNELDAKYRGQFIIHIAGSCPSWDQEYSSYINKDNKSLDLNIRRIENEEIPNLFVSADYLVLPYIDITQSGPLLISYYYGVPVIGSNHEGFKEYIEHGVSGFIFENKNSESLAKVMGDIIEGKYNKDDIQSGLEKLIKHKCSLPVILDKYQNGFDYFINE